jgi:hypothetical protein
MKTLVLAPSFAPIDEIPVNRAVLLLLEGKAQSLRDHPTRVFRNADGRVRVPAPVVIVLEALADFAGVVFGRASWTRGNVYLRDGHRCMYCGRHESDLARGHGRRDVMVRYGTETIRLTAAGEFLTIDHVTPESRGGRNVYENTVTACSTCNARKDNRTPAEARMYLRRKPRAMTRAEVFLGRLGDEARAAVEELFDPTPS